MCNYQPMSETREGSVRLLNYARSLHPIVLART